MKLDPAKLWRQAKRAAQKNPDAVRRNLDKAQEFVDDKTGGKYHDKIESGGDALEKGLGVPQESTYPRVDDPPATEPTGEPKA